MARVKLSEYKAKDLIYSVLNVPYGGISVEASRPLIEQIEFLDEKKLYVVKVDEGVKKRFKKGLIGLKKKKSEVHSEIERLQKAGYSRFIIEEFLEYDSHSEHYFAVERTRDGYLILFSEKGGVDIEEHSDSIKRAVVPYGGNFDDSMGLSSEFLHSLITVFDEMYLSFIEINPLLVMNHSIILLDVACEADDAGEFFVNGKWTLDDTVEHRERPRSEEEKKIKQLDEGSPASLKFELLNPDGSVFLLLSGGGASIALADELYNLGFGKEIANYGEYSGNPNDEETYTYTKNVLSLLLKSKAKKKVLIIAGGVANFTDIRKTFTGVIRALKENVPDLQKHGVKVFVRRGGPYQSEGLEMMRQFLKNNGIFGSTDGPDLVLTGVVSKALEYIR